MSRRNKNLKQGRLSGGGWGVILTILLTILGSLLITLTVVPIISPSAGADGADMLRSVVGPGPVAILESKSFQLQDKFNQIRAQINGGYSQIALSSQSQSLIEPTLAPAAQPATNDQTTPLPSSIQAIQNTPEGTINVISDAPLIGWQAYGPDVNGYPAMARVLLKLDPQRSYTAIALVRIDLFKLHLHIMPGYEEPGHPSQIVKVLPDMGMVAPGDQNHLVAAFNGGFKRVHGHYGMMVSGITLLPPQDGLATVALYHDGRVQIGVWGAEINQTPDLVAFRQNCPPLIEAGKINPGLYLDNRTAWGYTNNSDITWRTGLGITQDGRYLIYAVGNGTSVATLAEALQKAGAYMAMQLDINQYYAHFDTYQPTDSSSTSQGFRFTGERLVNEMINNPHLYLLPYPRDFFYLTDQ